MFIGVQFWIDGIKKRKDAGESVWEPEILPGLVRLAIVLITKRRFGAYLNKIMKY